MNIWFVIARWETTQYHFLVTAFSCLFDSGTASIKFGTVAGEQCPKVHNSQCRVGVVVFSGGGSDGVGVGGIVVLVVCTKMYCRCRQYTMGVQLVH